MKFFTKFGIVIVFMFLLGAGCDLVGNSAEELSGPGGVFVSTDRGENWTASALVPTIQGNKNFSAASVFAFVEDPKDPSALYWLTRGQGLLYSYDDGRSWQQAGEPLNSGFIYSVSVHPKENCNIIAANGRQILRSTDCNRTWTEVYREGRPKVTVRSVAFDPFGNHTVYALAENGDLLFSDNNGESWTIQHRFDTKVVKIVFDMNRPNTAYVVTRNKGLLRSTDGLNTWQSLAGTMSSFAEANEYRGFYINPGRADHLYSISKYGILVSRNAGQDWDPLNLITPPGGAAIYGFALNRNNEKELYYTATINNKSTFYRSEDGGKNWVTKQLPSGQIPTALRVHPEHPTWIYLGFTIPNPS